MNSPKFGTKATTLEALSDQARCFRVPPLVCFGVNSWAASPANILETIATRFANKTLAVRSSSYREDSATESHAGMFDSVLSIEANDVEAVRAAISRVLDSYDRHSTNLAMKSEDEIFVQEMVTDIDASGVILTRCVDDGSPYYVFSYDDESGSSDTVTSGAGTQKTVLLYRHARPEHCDSPRLRKMLLLARELEHVFDDQPLDIEFALTRSGTMNLLQVRPIATARKWHGDVEQLVGRAIPQVEGFIRALMDPQPGILGKTTLLGNMPDWNPAELIGAIPRPMAASLYRDLISNRTWHEARAAMGYRELPPTELMVLIAGHAMIDVRASFNSFLPAGLSDSCGEKLVNYWLDRLATRPSLHDKVELELVPTVADFEFANRLDTEYAAVLSQSEAAEWRERLLLTTQNIVSVNPSGSLSSAESLVASLADQKVVVDERQSQPYAALKKIATLLHECRSAGTFAFAVLARHAFVAESFLRSAVSRGVLEPARLNQYKNSIKTVMGDFAEMAGAVHLGRATKAEFFEKFGHLRPGTFDLCSPCYRDRHTIFEKAQANNIPPAPRATFEANISEQKGINRLLYEAGLGENIDATGLFSYAERAIRGREYGKFIFTRHLSAALEELAAWGAYHHMSREELSHLRIEEILDTGHRSPRTDVAINLMQKVDQARLDQAQARAIRLSYLVRGVRDIHVVPIHRSEPSFITDKNIAAPLVRLWSTSVDSAALYGSVVLIENADPGFDWIFTCGIVGLVTKYGGANSHMAIRCAELQLPAAIGCGEALFETLKRSRHIELDCASKRVVVT